MYDRHAEYVMEVVIGCDRHAEYVGGCDRHAEYVGGCDRHAEYVGGCDRHASLPSCESILAVGVCSWVVNNALRDVDNIM